MDCLDQRLIALLLNGIDLEGESLLEAIDENLLHPKMGAALLDFAFLLKEFALRSGFDG